MSLHLLFGILLIFSCAPPHAGISCYSSFVPGGVGKVLIGNHGRRGLVLEDCSAATECFEALAKPIKGLEPAMYLSGCGSDCPQFGYPSDCTKCSSSKCNKVIAKSIWTTHRLCFFANREKVVGKRQVYCNKDIDSCNLTEDRDENNVIVYTAFCGNVCWDCTICKENLCNAPPDVKKKALDELRVIEEEDAKEDAPVDSSGGVKPDGGSGGGVKPDSGSGGGVKPDGGSGGGGEPDGGSGGTKNPDGSSSASNADNGGESGSSTTRDNKKGDKKGHRKAGEKDVKGGKKVDDDDDTDADSGSRPSVVAVQFLMVVTGTFATIRFC